MASFALVAVLALPSVAAEGPCDILVAAGNPCVAAHSTVRALYEAYSGPLYRVSRTDGRDADVGALEAGGFANISAQDGFCAAGDCNITKIYDQSGKGNHLGQRISCVPGQGCVYHKMVNASRHKIGVQGGEVYGMWLDPGYGYDVDVTTDVAKGNEPESIYAVMSGTHYNGECCFDCKSSISRSVSACCVLPTDSAQWVAGCRWKLGEQPARPMARWRWEYGSHLFWERALARESWRRTRALGGSRFGGRNVSAHVLIARLRWPPLTLCLQRQVLRRRRADGCEQSEYPTYLRLRESSPEGAY